MPELPEVETIKNVLKHNLKNTRLKDIELLYLPLLESDSPFDFKYLKDKMILDMKRRGKYLIFVFEDDLNWVVHLRMEGKFYLYKEETQPTKHTHLIFETDSTYGHYLDVRKFSRMAIVKDLDQYFISKNLGYEPWDSRLTPTVVKEMFKDRKKNIKACLLDQSMITGIGNIYADEILFASKINPKTPAQNLSLEVCELLLTNIQNILEKAISEGGTTIRSYSSSLGVTGRFQVTLKAYGKENEPCENCGTLLIKEKVAGRGTVYCPNCQKEAL